VTFQGFLARGAIGHRHSPCPSIPSPAERWVRWRPVTG
jgi:hypothetical protein